MKTTVDLPDSLLIAAKALAARQLAPDSSSFALFVVCEIELCVGLFSGGQVA
jgi:hypothetical protein